MSMDKTDAQKKFADWYDKNREERNARRRARYQKDKDFRDGEKARVQAHRDKHPQMGPRHTYRSLNGVDTIVVRIGEAAERAGTTPEIIRRYEAEGLIPIPTWDDEPQRLYTRAQCALIKRMADLRRKHRAASDHPKVTKMVAIIFKKWNDK